MATKRGRLSKVEIFYIDGHRDKDPHDIAADLNRNLKVIQKHIEDNPVAATESKSTMTLAGENIGRNKNGTTVMTEAASSAADGRKRSSVSQTHDYCTAPIKNDE